MAKIYTFEEVGKYNQKDDCWIIIHGKVYDVTSFLYDHPGGGDVFLVAPDEKDASVGFDEVGHSEAAIEMLETYFVGHSEAAIEMLETYFVGNVDGDTIPSGTVVEDNHTPPPGAYAPQSTNLSSNDGFNLKLLVALLILALPFFLQYYYGKGNSKSHNGDN
ncbi:hypothetical protein PIB30_049015 [Stylosanthes scabra]|uniref:Cytochrome b5 heme-binding domain-containing protein n=1 Tax=Stylosanthes scabra TaxID=79078 RepID=A0ABU6QGR5_9FABA|nr:hypothetical protein [Stylosanthes scabra]